MHIFYVYKLSKTTEIISNKFKSQLEEALKKHVTILALITILQKLTREIKCHQIIKIFLNIQPITKQENMILEIFTYMYTYTHIYICVCLYV